MSINFCTDLMTAVDATFNLAGCIPVVGAISGSIRCNTYAEIQFVAGIALMGIGLFAQALSSEPQEWSRLTYLGVETFKHSFLNLGRGLFEAMLGLTIVGSPLLFFPNSSTGFNPYFFPYRTYRPLA